MKKSKQNRNRIAPPTLVNWPSVCGRCNKAYRSGARFCTRCGLAVNAQPAIAPVAVSRPQHRPAIQFAERPAAKSQPATKSTGLRLLFAALLAGGLLIMAIRAMDHPDFPSAPAAFQIPSLTELTPLQTGMFSNIPPAPDPDRPLPARSGPWSGAAIQMAWTEPNVLDHDGVVGLAVHAKVYLPGMIPARFVAHFRLSDGTPVKSNDNNYSDMVGDVAMAADVRPGGGISEISVFVPVSALKISARDQTLKLLPALYEPGNQPIATGLSIPFNLERGNVFISQARVTTLPQGARSLYVKVQTYGRQTQVSGQVIVRLKDAAGNSLPGRAPYMNADGELMADATFHMPAGPETNKSNDLTIDIPRGVTMPVAAAEVRLFDQHTGFWMSPPLRVPMQ